MEIEQVFGDNNAIENIVTTSLDLLLPERNPAVVYLSSLRPTGRRSQKQALKAVAILLTSGATEDPITFPWHTLRYQHMTALRSALLERNPATANKMLTAVKRVLLEARRLGLIKAEEYIQAVDIKSIKSETLPRGRALASGEMIALMKACARDTTPAGARDAALVAVLYSAGLRRSEVVALDLADYDEERGALTIRAGKGRKDRLTYIESGTGEALAAWLKVRGDEPGALFCPVNKGGNIQLRRLTDRAVFWATRKRSLEAGVKSFSPHDLRRTFISDLLDAGADIATVQKLAGHSSVVTTARYDRRGEASKKKAVGLLHVPYTKDQ